MSIGRETAEVARQTGPWIEKLARIGYAAKGVVYVLIGALTLKAAIGSGGRITDTRGAFRALLEQPFGKTILFVVGAGLVGYALWRLACAFLDAEGRGSDAKGIAIRVGEFARAVAHGALAVQAFRLASGRSSSSGNNPSEASAMVMSRPFGIFLLGAAGLAIIGYGLYQVYRGWRAKLSKQLRLTMSAEAKRWTIAASRAGIAARGIVFSVIGFFVLQAALKHDASEARGLGGALRAIGESGPWLLPLVAAGLIGYGIYEFIQARYRIVRV